MQLAQLGTKVDELPLARKISGWNQPNHGPARTGTVALKRADQFLQKLKWNGHWKQLSLGCLPPKLLPMKTGQSVSNRSLIGGFIGRILIVLLV